ncbi:hypothetical protein BKA93DRAFT_358272 [Sparassis latifolia]
MLSTVAISALLVAASAAPSLALPVVPTSGREAVNWKDVGGGIVKTPFHFEHPYVARADGEALRIGRPFEVNKLPVHFPTFVSSHAARDSQFMARAEPTDREAFYVNRVARDTGSAILNFLREEDPIMARAFEDELMARAELAGSEGVTDTAFARRSGKATTPPTSPTTAIPQAVSISWTGPANAEVAAMHAADFGGEDPKKWHEDKVHAFVSANTASLPGVTKARIR